MSDIFEQEYHVRWSDLDPNMHMRHTAYADLCAATRFSYLESLGFTMEKFAELKIGPIIFNENVSYLSEIRSGEKVMVDVRIAGLSEDGRKWKMVQRVRRKSDGKMAATLEILGAWFDVVERKVTTAPEILQSKMDQLPKTEDFKTL